MGLGLMSGRETAGGYRPSLYHKLFSPHVSGNAMNGLGETRRQRPYPIYHRRDFWHPWRMIQDAFYMRAARFSRFRGLLMAMGRIDKRQLPPIAAEQEQDTPENWSARVKAFAGGIGVDEAGIARIDPEWIFLRDEVKPGVNWVIVFGMPMDYERLSRTQKRDFRSGLDTVLESYHQGHMAAQKTVDWIRARGFYAWGTGTPMGSPINIIPAAIAAGLGELGKHGSLINRRYGSCLRLAYVVTDMPLTADAPQVFGADDFCTSCQVCVRECPPDAIFKTKQMVRGVTRWYVDFDKCVPYFNEHLSCAICLAVCPWSMPGVSENLAQKLARRKTQTSSGGP